MTDAPPPELAALQQTAEETGMAEFLAGPTRTRLTELPPQAGATLVAVCQADPARAAAVAERRGYRFPLLCDPDLVAYQAYGLPEGVPATITQDFPWRPGDTETAEQWTVSRRGTERALVDHAWQLPGEFVIAPGGRIALTHRAQFCEDLPLIEVILGAVAAARV